MLNLEDKIEYLKIYLSDIKDNYADSFKTDIALFFYEFEDVHKIDFEFLDKLNSQEDIHLWVDSLTSRIVMKFAEDEEHLSEFIFYTINS